MTTEGMAGGVGAGSLLLEVVLLPQIWREIHCIFSHIAIFALQPNQKVLRCDTKTFGKGDPVDVDLHMKQKTTTTNGWNQQL